MVFKEKEGHSYGIVIIWSDRWLSWHKKAKNRQERKYLEETYVKIVPLYRL